MSAASTSTHRLRRDGRAFTVTVTLVAALCALPIIALVVFSGAPKVIILAVALAFVPVGPLVAAYLWLDRYEPEPRGLLALALAWGAFVATLLALLIGGIGQFVAPVTDEQSLAILAPVTEEATKGAFLLLLLWWRRAELDGILDAIVYAGMVGIGFAFVENILYLAAAYNGTDGTGPGGLSAVTGLFVFRCLMSPFAHPLFTTFTGIGVGIAVGSRSRAVRFGAPLVGYGCAVVAHGIWNASTLYGGAGFLGVYVILGLPALLSVAGFAVWTRGSEARLLHAALSDAARRGLFPAEDIPYVVDLRARRALVLAADRVDGAVGAAARRYVDAAVQFGFLHHRFLRGTPPKDFARRGQGYVVQLRLLRPRVAFAGAFGETPVSGQGTRQEHRR